MPGNSITAARHFAASGAGVAIVCVAVIARLHLHANHAIAAACRRTGAQTSISIVCVSIVTLFADLDNSITAGGRHAVGAVISRVLVAVIAAFAGGDDAVAAGGLKASRQAGV